MTHPASSRRHRCPTWRCFDRRDGRQIETRLYGDEPPCCPLCGVYLEARPGTRFHTHLVLDASGYDLDCRDCRRFWCVVQHTPRSLHLLRMRRFIAALRAAGRASASAPRPAMHAGYSAVA